MDFITHILAVAAESWPQSGIWETLLGWFHGFIKDYALTIIVFTIVLKIVLSPLDFWQRKVSREMVEKQSLIKPELEAIQKEYGDRRDIMNQKQMELYKRHNVNMIGSCVATLVNILLSFGIFLTLFNGLHVISNTKIAYQYKQYDIAYSTVIEAGGSVEDAQAAVLVKYDELKDDFLWVKNIWKSDTATSPALTFEDYKNTNPETLKKIDGETSEEYDARIELFKERFEAVMLPIKEQYSGFAGWNGYYILIILAAVTTIASQMILSKILKPKNAPKRDSAQPDPTETTNKVMLVVLPIIMVLFTLSTSALFALYVVVNSVVSTVFTLGLNKVIIKMNEKKSKDEVVVVDYRR